MFIVRLHHRQVLILVCLISLIAGTDSCLADNSPRARLQSLPNNPSLSNIEEQMSQPQLNAAQIDQLSRMLGMNQDSALFRAIISGDEQKLKSHLPEFVPPEKSKQAPKILKHFKNSNAGLRLTTPQDIIDRTRVDIEKVIQVANKMVQDQVETAKRNLELGPIPNCSQDKREVIQRGKVPKAQQRSRDFDLLFINKNDQSFTPDLSLGDNLRIKIYDPERPSLYGYTLKGMGIHCLPYRLRLTNSQIFKLQGKPALQDFSRKKKEKSTEKIGVPPISKKIKKRRHK